MTTNLSKSPRSGWSNFVHDLVSVDFHQAVPLRLSVRLAIILIAITVVGLITGHIAEASFVWLGTLYVLCIDLVLDLNNRSKDTRTQVLLAVSLLFPSVFAIGTVISMNDNLVIPLCGFGLFLIAYFTVYPKAYWILLYISLIFVIAINYQDATLAQTGQNFLLIFVGGLWAIVGGMIFLARKTSKEQHTITTDPIQEQSQSKLTWQ